MPQNTNRTIHLDFSEFHNETPVTSAQTSAIQKFRRAAYATRVVPQPDFSTTALIERVQVHGLADFYHAKSITARFFWFCLLVVCSTIATTSISQSIQQFLQRPVRTTVTKIPSRSMFLPPTYICPSKYIDSNKVTSLGLESEAREVMTLIEDKLMGRAFSFAKKGGAPVSTVSHPNTAMSWSLFDVKKRLLKIGYQPSEVFRACSIAYTILNCAELFVPVVDQWRGLCFQIRPEILSNYPVWYAGQGLHLFIDLHSHTPTTLNGSIPSFFTGVSVKFGQDANPYSFGGHLAGPGKYVRYSMYKQVNRLLRTRWKEGADCLDENNEPEFVYLNTSYSPITCHLDCYLRANVPRCDCSNLIYATFIQKKFESLLVCSPSGNCMGKNLSPSQGEQYKRCLGGCISKCETVEYAVHETSMELGSPEIWMGEGHKMSLDFSDSYLSNLSYWKSSAAMINIVFAQMNYLLIEQAEAITLVQLVADIGGQAGLWLGASILSLCQLLALLLSWCYAKYRNRGKQRNGTNLDMHIEKFV